MKEDEEETNLWKEGGEKGIETYIDPRLHGRVDQQPCCSEDEDEDDGFVFAGIAFCIAC